MTRMNMLLCTSRQNSQSKDAHWFYKSVTDRVVSRRSFDRVSGISQTWLNGRKDIGYVYDGDGNK